MVVPRGRTRVVAALVLLLAASPARAAHKRPVPDYDGRHNADAEVHAGALWLPRIVLWPLAVLEDHAIRRPLGALVATAERHRWPARIHDALTFGARQQDYVTPTFAYEFGMQPSIGAYMATTDLGVAGNDLRVHGATWGPSWLTGTLADTYRATPALSFAARVSAVRRPDYLFLGTGPDTTSATRARYGRQRFDGRVSLVRGLGGASSLALSAGAQETAFRAGTCCGDPSLDARIDRGELAPPAGYGAAYATAYQRAELVLDSRAPRPAPATGVFARAHAQTSIHLTADRRWLAYGGGIGAAIDLDGHQRALSLELVADVVDPWRGTVPFDELPVLGPDVMPGFVAGWMTGRSTAAAQLAYTWPAWIWLDGELRISAGNAFDTRFTGLAPDELRLSGEVGLATTGARDRGFEVALGVGTTPLDDGAHLDSVRFVIRSRRDM